MKLNHDCIRSALLYLESENYVNIDDSGAIAWAAIDIKKIYKALPEYSKEDIYYSLYNLEQAGYINAVSIGTDASVCGYLVNYITFSGHEFLESIRDIDRWQKVKSILSHVKDYSLSAISAVAEGVTSAYIQKVLSAN